MLRRSLLLPALAAAVLALAQAPDGVAQPPNPNRPSHLPLGDTPTDLSHAELMLKMRMAKAKDVSDLKDLVQRLLKDQKDLDLKLSDKDKESLKKLVDQRLKSGEKMPDLGKDPELKQLFDKVKNDPKLADKDREFLKRVIPPDPPKPPENKDPVRPPQTGKDRPPDTGKPPENKDPVKPPDLSKGQPPTPPDPTKGGPGTPNPPPQQGQMPDWVTRQVMKMAEGVSKADKSPSGDALRGFLKDVKLGEARKLPDFDLGLGKMVPDGTGEKATSLLPKEAPDLGPVGKWVSGMKMPSWPSGNAPSLPDAPSVPGAPGLPSAPGVGDPSGVVTVVFWVIVAGVAVFVLWWLVPMLRQAGSLLGRERRGLGPWPVEPSQVSTRQDIIKAFEYLALKCLGRPAEAYHHREVAARIGQQAQPPAPARQESVNHLASVYEQARYTPADEDLSPADVEAARRELRDLAGAAA